MYFKCEITFSFIIIKLSYFYKNKIMVPHEFIIELLKKNYIYTEL